MWALKESTFAIVEAGFLSFETLLHHNSCELDKSQVETRWGCELWQSLAYESVKIDIHTVLEHLLSLCCISIQSKASITSHLAEEMCQGMHEWVLSTPMHSNHHSTTFHVNITYMIREPGPAPIFQHVTFKDACMGTRLIFFMSCDY